MRISLVNSVYFLINYAQTADLVVEMSTDELEGLEIMLGRFNRLIGELSKGMTARNSFLPWEVEILLDIESCELDRRRRMDTLRQYQRAVERQMQTGPGPPMKLSTFLEQKARRRELANLEGGE